MKICSFDDIPDGAARAFDLPGLPPGRNVLVARAAGGVFAYENRCPHTGVNLDWFPDQFMDADGVHLQCATHGALFRVQDGYCVHGPCAGQGLAPVPIRVRDGGVELADPAPVIAPETGLADGPG